MEICNHDYRVCGYNSAIVIEICNKCDKEIEFDFDNYCSEYGFPTLNDDDE